MSSMVSSPPVRTLIVCLFTVVQDPSFDMPQIEWWSIQSKDLEVSPWTTASSDAMLTHTSGIYGQGRNLQKSSGYAPHPYFPKVFNTHNCIDKTMHGRKRRIVSQGFSESAIASSERYVLDHVRNLCDVLTNPAEVGRDGWSVARDMGVWSTSCRHMWKQTMLIRSSQQTILHSMSFQT